MFYFFPISLPALKKCREAPQRIRILPAVFLANRLSLPKDRLLRCIGGRQSFARLIHCKGLIPFLYTDQEISVVQEKTTVFLCARIQFFIRRAHGLQFIRRPAGPRTLREQVESLQMQFPVPAFFFPSS